MTRSVRLMTGTTGTCLLASAFVLLFFLPAENVWPWVLLFVSLGVGLVTGSIISQGEDLAAQRAAREAE
jgi:hypothetical protein